MYYIKKENIELIRREAPKVQTLRPQSHLSPLLRLWSRLPRTPSSQISSRLFYSHTTSMNGAPCFMMLLFPAWDSFMSCSSLITSPVDILLEGVSWEQETPSRSSEIRLSILASGEKIHAVWNPFSSPIERWVSTTSSTLPCRPSSTYSRRLSPPVKLLSVGLFPVTISNTRIP